MVDGGREKARKDGGGSFVSAYGKQTRPLDGPEKTAATETSAQGQVCDESLEMKKLWRSWKRGCWEGNKGRGRLVD